MAKRKRLAPAQTLAQPRDQTGLTPEAKPTARLSAHPAPPIASVAGDASSTAALAELSETLRRARAEGRMILAVPLTQIDEAHLVRDRIAVDDDDMAALRASIAARGQQTPIELVEIGAGRYGLISGWRRLQALRALGQDTAKAIVTPPRDAPDAYVAMIEENEIRVGLSYFERARIVVKSVESGIFDSDKTALQTLFSSASRAKRSKIKSFMPVVQSLGDTLKFPTQLGERLGLQLSKAILGNPDAAARLADALAAADPQDAEAEFATLEQALNHTLEPKEMPESPTPKAPKFFKVTPVVGVQVSTSGKSITLKGQRVDPRLYNDLLQWLKARG